MQVSDKERKLHYDSLFKDIAGVLVAKCVNADTNRPYTISMLERSLHDIHFAVDPKRPAKQQALEVRLPSSRAAGHGCILSIRSLRMASLRRTAERERGSERMSSSWTAPSSYSDWFPFAVQAIPELQKVIPIRRARMRLKLQVPPSVEHELEQLLRKEDAVIETQSATQAQVHS